MTWICYHNDEYTIYITYLLQTTTRVSNMTQQGSPPESYAIIRRWYNGQKLARRRSHHDHFRLQRERTLELCSPSREDRRSLDWPIAAQFTLLVPSDHHHTGWINNHYRSFALSRRRSYQHKFNWHSKKYYVPDLVVWTIRSDSLGPCSNIDARWYLR